MHVKGLAALRLALVEEAIFSGHFNHVTRSPTLAGVAVMSNVLSLRRDGHVVVRWSDFVVAAATHDHQLLANEDVVDAETTLLNTVVRLLFYMFTVYWENCSLVDHNSVPSVYAIGLHVHTCNIYKAAYADRTRPEQIVVSCCQSATTWKIFASLNILVEPYRIIHR